MRSFFLDRAVEWRLIADELREEGVPEHDPALRVWREAAWCHLLLNAGHEREALDCLRVAVSRVTGRPEPAHAGPATLFAHLHAAVSARYPSAFGLLAHC